MLKHQVHPILVQLFVMIVYVSFVLDFCDDGLQRFGYHASGLNNLPIYNGPSTLVSLQVHH